MAAPWGAPRGAGPGSEGVWTAGGEECDRLSVRGRSRACPDGGRSQTCARALSRKGGLTPLPSPHSIAQRALGGALTAWRGGAGEALGVPLPPTPGTWRLFLGGAPSQHLPPWGHAEG